MSSTAETGMATRGVRATVGVLLVLLLALMGPVVYQLVMGSVTSVSLDGAISFTAHYYADLLGDGDSLRAALNTVLFAVGSTLVATVVGGFQAWVAERTNAPLRRLAYAGALTLIGMPYLVYVIAWVLVLGRGGLVNSALAALTGSDNPAIFDVNSLVGMVFIEGFVWSPMAFLLIAASLKQANPAFEEAARMSGAGIGVMVRRITIPLAWPAVLAVGLLTLIRSMEAFEVPAIVGLPGNVQVVTTQVYTAIQQEMPPDYGRASAVSVGLMVVVGLLLWWNGTLTRRAERYQVVTGSHYRPAALNLGRWRYPAAAGSALVFLVVVAVPLAMLVWVSVVPVYQGVDGSLFHFTLRNFTAAVHTPSLAEGTVNTLLLCLGAAVVSCLAASLVAWFVVRRATASRLLDQLMSLPLVVPGIVVGLAVSQVGLTSPVPLYGTVWVLALGYLITFLPFAMRYAYTGAIQIQAALEESARVAGARYPAVFRRIVLPLLMPAMVTGGLFVFMQGVRALSMPVFLASPQHPVAAVSLYELWSNGSTTTVAAFGVLWTAAMVLVAGVLSALARRSRVSLF
ncbi:ABC transporter permease [Streptomyces sp. NPDC050560]|uniref:ABC transporter permease n=1 Tax=Streptomyces sp. NPDC050560 TaxID=3365630 RepID=UPI0037AA939E